MIVRIELSDRKNKTVYIFLPMKNDSNTIFDPSTLPYPWPPMTGMWNGKKFFGDPDYNEDTKKLVFECSDGDKLLTDIDMYTVLRLGSRIILESAQDGKVLFEVTDWEVL
jgi:hypothetical protein